MNHVTSPANNDSAIEQEIQAKGKTAPRVTPADLLANIVGEHYFEVSSYQTISDDGVVGMFVSEQVASPEKIGSPAPVLNILTFCVLVLRNGFTVTGESACASPENFDAVIGRKISRQNAEGKVWPLMGYALKERLANAKG